MKPVIKNIFAFLGVVLLTYGIYNFIQSERLTEKYWENLSKVKVGMSLYEARQIVGDLKYQYWTQDDQSGEIIITKNAEGKITYAVEYDMVFAGSDNPKIYFDPNTLTVTEVITGE